MTQVKSEILGGSEKSDGETRNEMLGKHTYWRTIFVIRFLGVNHAIAAVESIKSSNMTPKCEFKIGNKKVGDFLNAVSQSHLIDIDVKQEEKIKIRIINLAPGRD